MQICHMKIMKMTAAILPLLGALSAEASDFKRPDMRGETYCYPAKYAAKTIAAMESLKPTQKDVVAASLKPQFLIYDDGPLPERYYIKDKRSITDFTLQPDGRVPDFIPKVKAASQQADLCIHDPVRAAKASDDESLYFEMGLTPFYKNTSGRHGIAELAEGMKDGKSQYKKMIPAAARIFMPDTRCLHVKYDTGSTAPQIFADVRGEFIPLETEYYNEGYVLHFDDLKKMGAEALIIQGGTYKLSPVPSVKTMKRYGIGRPRGPKAKTSKAH